MTVLTARKRLHDCPSCECEVPAVTWRDARACGICGVRDIPYGVNWLYWHHGDCVHVTREELVARLRALDEMSINEHRIDEGMQPFSAAEKWADHRDPEASHEKADRALLEFINDPVGGQLT